MSNEHLLKQLLVGISILTVIVFSEPCPQRSKCFANESKAQDLAVQLKGEGNWGTVLCSDSPGSSSRNRDLDINLSSLTPSQFLTCCVCGFWLPSSSRVIQADLLSPLPLSHWLHWMLLAPCLLPLPPLSPSLLLCLHPGQWHWRCCWGVGLPGGTGPALWHSTQECWFRKCCGSCCNQLRKSPSPGWGQEWSDVPTAPLCPCRSCELGKSSLGGKRGMLNAKLPYMLTQPLLSFKSTFMLFPYLIALGHRQSLRLISLIKASIMKKLSSQRKRGELIAASSDCFLKPALKALKSGSTKQLLSVLTFLCRSAASWCGCY